MWKGVLKGYSINAQILSFSGENLKQDNVTAVASAAPCWKWKFSLLPVRKVEDSRINDPHTAESSGHACSEPQNNKSSFRFKPSFCSENTSGEHFLQPFPSAEKIILKHSKRNILSKISKTNNKEWLYSFGWKLKFGQHHYNKVFGLDVQNNTEYFSSSLKSRNTNPRVK